MKKQESYPSPLEKWSVQKDNAYGLRYAKTIAQEWFNGGVITDDCLYGAKKTKIRENRLFVRGEQSVDYAKKLFGDTSMANLDFTIQNYAKKFCRVVSNGIGDEHYTLDVRANDRLSLKLKQDERKNHLKNMRAMPLIAKTKELLGLDLTPQGFVPKNEEDLNMYEQLKPKPKIEIAEEIIIDYIKKTNNFRNIEKNKNRDLVDNDICAVRVYTDISDGVKIQEIDIERLVYSNVTKNDFSDAFYFGFIDTITLGDLKRESQLTDDVLRKIAPTYSKRNKAYLNYNTCKLDELLGHKVDVLRYCFKTNKTEVYKKTKRKGKTVKIVKKDDSFNPPERKDYGKLEDSKTTWMEGNYIVGTEYVYDYKESERIIRDEQNKAVAPFIVRATDIYENRLRSFLDDIKPLCNELQNVHLKIQHLRSQLKPDLIQIDIDQLAELGGEEEKKEDAWEESLKILDIKGVVFTKRINMGDDGIKDSAPVRPMPMQQGTGLTALLNLHAHYYNQIRDITGINPARDGSLRPDALLGVNEMAQLASNTVTKHIVDAAIDFNKRVAEVISTRVHQIFRNKNAKHLRKLYERAVGKQNIDALESLKDRHLHDFGFTVEMLPTQQELQELRQYLDLSIKKGYVDADVAYETMRLAKTNIKLANQYLFYMRKKRIEEEKERQEHIAKTKSQSDIAASNAATQNQTQLYGTKIQMDLKYQEGLAKIEVLKQQALLQIEAPLEDKKFKQDVYLAKIKEASTFNLSKFKEDAKDLRVDKQSTHQSKMIVERKSNNPKAIDFENPFNFDFSMQ